MLGTCLSTGAAGDGDASHDAMACIFAPPSCDAGTGGRDDPLRAGAPGPGVGRRWIANTLRKVLYAHGYNVLCCCKADRLWGAAPTRAGSFGGLARGHIFSTVAVSRLHVVVKRHIVAMLRRMLVSSAPARMGDSLMNASESDHTRLRNLATPRKNIHVAPGQHVTLAPILH